MKLAVLAGAAALVSFASAAEAGCGVGCGTLWNQNANFGQAIVSTAGIGTQSAAAVDDFISSGWRILEVDITGTYLTGGPADSFTFTFYRNKKGAPGKIVRDYSFAIGCTDNAGSLICEMPIVRGKQSGLPLKAGHYWMSVVANCPSGCEWGWTENTTVQDDAAMWENPDNGWNTDCTNWEPLASCGFGSAADFAFTIKGL